MATAFDDEEFPLAYFISYRCYGTWLHGDSRGSVDRKNNVYGTPKLPVNKNLENSEARLLKHPPFKLNATCRKAVDDAVREVCSHRHYLLRALNVRTNHVHSVVSARKKPEPILNAFQAYSTRKLRERGLLALDVKPWSRHGSTIYLWSDEDVFKAIEYVMSGQGGDFEL